MLQVWHLTPSQFGDLEDGDRVFIEGSWIEHISRYNKAVE